MSNDVSGVNKLWVAEKQLRADIDDLIQEVWREWCFSALKEYDDTVYQGIIRGVIRIDSNELKGYKCILQKRLIKKDKFNEVLDRLIQSNDIDVIESAHGGPLLIMGSEYIKKHGLKLEQHQVLIYATTKVAIRLMSVDDVINEINRRG